MKDVPAELITKTKRRIHRELNQMKGEQGVTDQYAYYKRREEEHFMVSIIIAVCGICALILIVAVGLTK